MSKENNVYNRFLKLSANDYEDCTVYSVQKLAHCVLKGRIRDDNGRTEVLLQNGRREYMRANYEHEKKYSRI